MRPAPARGRLWIGLGRGGCLGFVATLVTSSVLEALVVLIALVTALVLTDALADSEGTR